MSRPNDFNQRNIDDFRAHAGQVSGAFAGRPLILLTTTGRKSGKQHTTPVMYRQEGDHLAVFASKGGAPTQPDWYLNLVANPEVTVEVGADKYQAQATTASGKERDEIYARQAKEYPQ